MKKSIPAGKFKAECLKLMQQIHETKQAVIITKRKMPLVKIVPIEAEESLVGKMKGTVVIHGDLLAPIEEEWDASH